MYHYQRQDHSNIASNPLLSCLLCTSYLLTMSRQRWAYESWEAVHLICLWLTPIFRICESNSNTSVLLIVFYSGQNSLSHLLRNRKRYYSQYQPNIASNWLSIHCSPMFLVWLLLLCLHSIRFCVQIDSVTHWQAIDHCVYYINAKGDIIE